MNNMPINEKELNCYLLDQLEFIERLEIIAQNGNSDEILKQLALEKNSLNASYIKNHH